MESTLTGDHKRLNGKDIFNIESNGMKSFGENLAFLSYFELIVI